ncbi:hypothetical protein NESM_000571400 [Novymonas esmeraldas]|uniref:Uncharacterized protein n=1 Tax=Novymonas esmeraldas TaxID=1808958 RepID=A0AAW0ERM3_9TRYP
MRTVLQQRRHTAQACGVARRCLHTTGVAGADDAANTSASAGGAAPTDALQRDDTDEWIHTHLQRSVDSGRQSQAAADYFRGMMHDESDFRQCLVEARRLMGGQEPDQLTHYQQGQFADRLSTYMSGIASEKLRRAHAEEQSTRRYTQDGTPTGENYWFEAGNVLSSPGVPAYVKDEILDEMRQERTSASPAYVKPAEEAQLAAEDEDYAAHLRQQRHKLLGGVDFK